MCIEFDGNFWTAASAIATAVAVVVALFLSYRQHRKDMQKESLSEISGNLSSAVLGERACNMIRSVIAHERSAENLWGTKAAIHRAFDMVVDARTKVKDQAIADELQKVYAKLYELKFLLENSNNYNDDKEKLRGIISRDESIIYNSQDKLKEKIDILKDEAKDMKKKLDNFFVWPLQ